MRKWSFGRPPRQNRAPKSKSRSKPKPRPQPNPRPSPPNPSLDHDDSPALTSLERHARKCSVCSRPHREHIEEAFLQWRSPDTIMRRWDIKTRTANYHHAHAFNLFALRNRNLQWPRETSSRMPTPRASGPGTSSCAIRDLAHSNEDGRWVRPTHKSQVIVSTQGLPGGAGLPASQTALPAYTQPEAILIASQLLNSDANH